jgi:hypothetical protein
MVCDCFACGLLSPQVWLLISLTGRERRAAAALLRSMPNFIAAETFKEVF